MLGNIHARLHKCVCAHVTTHTNMHTNHAYLHMCVHTWSYSRILTCTHTLMSSHMVTYTHMLTYTYAHIYTHTQMHAQSKQGPEFNPSFAGHPLHCSTHAQKHPTWWDNGNAFAPQPPYLWHLSWVVEGDASLEAGWREQEARSEGEFGGRDL